MDVDYIAVLKKENNYDLEFLYQSPEGTLRDYSKKIAMQPNVEQVLIFYKTVMSRDYEFCKEELKLGNITPEDITTLLD